MSKTYKKFLRPSNIERDQMFKSKCDNLMERFNNFNIMNLNNENKESSPIIETPKKSSVNKSVSLSTSIYKLIYYIVFISETRSILSTSKFKISISKR